VISIIFLGLIIMQKIKKKYFTLILVLLLIILIDVIIFYNPLDISSERSILDIIPFSFWLLILAIPIILIVLLHSINSITLFTQLLSMIFIIILYSYNLLFKIIPEQSDIGATDLFINIINKSYYLDPVGYDYFEYPMFFTNLSIFKQLLGLGDYVAINLGFFVYLAIIPIILTLLLHQMGEKNNRYYFYYVVSYIILIYFFINDQFVPQFFGLIFLMITIGCYIQLKVSKNVLWYYLLIFFFTICVYTHSFMFFFFILGLLIDKIYTIIMKPIDIKIFISGDDKISIFKMISRSSKNIFSNIKNSIYIIFNILTIYFEKITGKREKKGISIIILLLIFWHGYISRFHSLESEIERVFRPQVNRGQTWYIISRLLGSKRSVGLISYRTYPLYNLVDKNLYLIVKYINLIILFFILFVFVIGIIKVFKKKILFFDIAMMIGSIVFTISGFFVPHIMGQRAIQVSFINPVKYIFKGLENSLIRKAFVVILIITPLFFTFSVTISHTLGGTTFIEDKNTLSAGEYVMKNCQNDTYIVVPDRSYYPLVPNYYFDKRYYRVTPGYISRNSIENNTLNIIIISNPKLDNNLKYYNNDLNDITEDRTIVYDQGISKIIIYNK